MANDITVSISQESVQSIVKAQIQTAVLGALSADGGGERMVQRLVQEALAAKVSRDYRSVSFLDDLITNVIQEETRIAVKAWVEKNRDKIQTAMQRAIEKDKSLSARLVSSLVSNVEPSYRVRVDVTPLRDE